MTLGRTARYLGLRLIRIRSHPREIARGFAFGIFSGMTPFLGFHIVLAVVLAILLKGNKFMALLGTSIGNPFTFSFIFMLDYKVGRWILGGDTANLRPVSFHPSQILESGWNILLPMSIGGLIVGLAAAILAYYISNPLVRGVQKLYQKR